MTTIRQATLDDVPRIVEMAQRFYPQSGYTKLGPMMKECAAGLALITMESGVMLVAESDDSLVGMVCLHVDPFTFNPNILIAHELVFWIEPEHRGGMLAVRMIKAGEQAAAECGAKWNRMATLAASDEAAGVMYERMGYVRSESYYVKEL